MVTLTEVDQLFFGACVEVGKTLSMVAEKNICITMAAIDPSKCKGTEPITLYKKKNDVEYVVCTLLPGTLYQQKLDLMFEMGEELSLLTKGNGTVHLTGYFIEEDHMPENPYDMDSDEGEDMDEEEEFDSDMEDMMDMDDDEEEEEGDDESEDEVIVQGKRKKQQKAPEAKKVKFQVELKKPDAKNDNSKNKQNNQKTNDQNKKVDQKQQQPQQKQQQQKQQQQQQKQQQEKKVAESPAGENKKKNKKKNKKNKNKNNKAN